MKLKKVAQVVIVLMIMALSYGVYFFVATRVSEKPEASIGANAISQGINPVGYFSDGWAKEIRMAEEFYDCTPLDYVVIHAVGAVETGVYTRKAWIGPYDGGDTNSVKRRRNPIPEESTNPMTDVEFMHPYYLIALEDGSYITAILEYQYAEALLQGETLTLPIGQQQGVTKQAQTMLVEATADYDVQVTPVLYMIDDAWYEENQGGINIVAMLWGAATFIALTLLCAFTLSSVFEDEVAERKRIK